MTASARLQRGALAAARQRVAAAELLRLPGAQRLQRVDGGDVRDAVEELGEVAGEVGVPGVAVASSAPSAAAAIVRSIDNGAQRGEVAARRRPARPTAGGAGDVGSRSRPSSATVDVLERAQLAREVLDVHARPAVDLRRVLAGQQRDASRRPPACPSGSRRCRRRRRVKRSRSRLGVDADLRARRRLHVLVEDRAAHDRAARRPRRRARGSSPRPAA